MTTLKVNSQDLGEAGTVDTYAMYRGDDTDDMLINEYNEEHNTNYNYDDFEWDYDSKQIVKEFAELRAKILESDDAINSVKVLETGSPKEYNYSTDWADFEIDYNERVVDDFCHERESEKFSEYYGESGWQSTVAAKEDDDDKDRLYKIAMLSFYLNNKAFPKWEDKHYPMFERELEIYWENTKMTLGKDK